VEAQRIVLAEQVDAGKIKRSEADLQMAQVISSVVSEEQKRRHESQMAVAATMAAMPHTTIAPLPQPTLPHPTICNTFGNSYGYGFNATTNCN
jgi:hypothetical protein